MKRKWMSVFGAMVIGMSISANGGTALATEKFKDIVNVSHRGASGHAPEHTIISYEMGQKMHGDYIEIDLQMTKMAN